MDEKPERAGHRNKPAKRGNVCKLFLYGLQSSSSHSLAGTCWTPVQAVSNGASIHPQLRLLRLLGVHRLLGMLRLLELPSYGLEIVGISQGFPSMNP